MSDTLNKIAEAFETLKAEMAADPEYAWSWHCNLAMPIMDAAGISHEKANVAAAYLMSHLFCYDVTTDERFQYKKSGAQGYTELRIAAEREEDAAMQATK